MNNLELIKEPLLKQHKNPLNEHLNPLQIESHPPKKVIKILNRNLFIYQIF